MNKRKQPNKVFIQPDFKWFCTLKIEILPVLMQSIRKNESRNKLLQAGLCDKPPTYIC